MRPRNFSSRLPQTTRRLLLVGLAMALSSCSQSDDGSGSAGDGSKLRIGMIPKLVGISYFDATHRGAKEAAEELGVDLIYDGPTDARSEDQIRMIDGWVAQGFDVIAAAPNDPDGIATTLRNAQQAGAHVLTWDTDANPERSRRSIFVNQAPNKEIGFALVDVMAAGVQARGESLAGEYLIVSGTATAANQNTWMEFMRQRIEEKYPEMKLLQHLTPGEDRQKSQEQTAEALVAHPELKGVWGITSVSLPAAAKAVRDAGLAKQIFVTGLSLPNDMREFVKDGTVAQFVLWDAVDLGYLTVQIAKRLADGELEAGQYDFGRLKGIEVRDGEAILGPPVIFNADNIDNYQF